MDVPTNVFQKLNKAFLEILIFCHLLSLLLYYYYYGTSNLKKLAKNQKNCKILTWESLKCRKKSKFQKKLNLISETY